MSVVGIDLGNINTVIAVARNRGVDIICNEVSNRTTPSLASFGPKNRFLGESAKTQEISNFRNTVGCIKRIIGRSLAEVTETESKFINCQLTEKDGQAAVSVQYCGEECVFSGTELMAMFLCKLKEITHAEVKNNAMEIVLSVPPYYNDKQRRAIMDAAEIAQVRCIRLANENLASALAYGMPKFDLPEDNPRNVCFVDVGESAYSVTIVAFKKGQLEIKGVGYDSNFGGRNFDEILAEHFCDEFMTKRKLDIRSNKKALYRLRAACERVKKILSANAVTLLSVENIMDDVDVSAQINRSDFEAMCLPLMSRFQAPISDALAMAKLEAHQIDSVELVGGSTRIPAIKEHLMRIFGREVSTTLNQDEAIARGCALQCALQSPVFKVREFSIQDITGLGVKYTWEAMPDTPEDFEYEVFPVGHHMPSTKMLSFKRPLPFTLNTVYSSTSTAFGTYTISAPSDDTFVDLSTSTIKVKTRVNPSGIFSIEGASVVPDQAESGVAPIILVVSTQNGSLSRKEVEAKAESEAQMHSADKLVADTSDSRNALEEYIYDIRSKVEGAFEKFASEEEKTKLFKKVSENEVWLYGEGEDATKSVYLSRLHDLKVIGGPITDRAREYENIPQAESVLRQSIDEYIKFTTNTDERYAHIDAADRSKIAAECAKKQKWIDETMAKQASRPLYQSLVVTSSQIIEEKNRLITACFPIINKPKPKTESTSASAAEPAKEEPLLTDEEDAAPMEE
jgi:heat shock 70kDa protein 4